MNPAWLPGHVHNELIKLRKVYENVLLRDGGKSKSAGAVRAEAKMLVARSEAGRHIKPSQVDGVVRHVWKETS